jgi:hypothetical protein
MSRLEGVFMPLFTEFIYKYLKSIMIDPEVCNNNVPKHLIKMMPTFLHGIDMKIKLNNRIYNSHNKLIQYP